MISGFWTGWCCVVLHLHILALFDERPLLDLKTVTAAVSYGLYFYFLTA